MYNVHMYQGGLISEKFHFGLNFQEQVQNHSPEHYPHNEKMLKGVISDLAPIFEDLSKSEKLFEIKPPLGFLNLVL